MARLVPRFALSKRDAEELRALVKRARLNHPVLDDEEELRRRARLFLSAGHELRLKILGLLEIEELCLCDMIKALGVPASTLTHHLTMLQEGGLVVSTENGKFTTFALRKDSVTKHRILQ